MKKIASTLAIYILLSLSVGAFTVPDKPTGYVNDYANVLSIEAKNQLESVLRIFSASTTNEIAVAIVPDLGGDTVEHYAVKLFDAWKIGTAKNDNGVLLLVAVDDRQLRIEVGYGLEGALPDILAKNIIDTKITPAFKEGDYAKGISQGVDSIILATQGEYQSVGSSSSFSLEDLSPLFIFGFVALQFLSALLARSKSWWAGGVMGGVIGGVITLFGMFGITIVVGGIITIALILLGLLFDYIVSRAYTSSVTSRGSVPWWAGGGGGSSSSSGGSFGGFGGGSSGGGGASGRW